MITRSRCLAVVAGLVVILLVIISLSAAGVSAVDKYQGCIRENAGNLAEQELVTECKWFAFGQSADSIAYILTAFATAGLVFYTLSLANVAKAQTAQLARTNEHSERVERAYVQMRSALPGLYEIFDPASKDQAHPDHMIKICVRNFGNTPAQVTDAPMWYTVVATAEALNADALAFPDHQHGNTAFLAAGEEFSFFQRIPREAFQPADQRFLWAYGYVDYKDTLGNRYRSGWARQFKKLRDDPRLYGMDKEAHKNRDNLTLIANDPNNYDRKLGPDEA